MRFRLGLAVGFASGYYLGARAGRERYDQINDFARRVKRSETFDTATDTAKDAMDLGVEKTKEAVEKTKEKVDSKRGDGEESNGAVVSPPPPEDPFLRPTPDL